MFNRNTAWKRLNDSYRFQTICLNCMILIGQFATAQDSLLPSEAGDASTQLRLSRIGSSVAGERIVSVTCDPFMSPSQEQTLMRMLQEHDDVPWVNLSLRLLKDRLSNACSVLIDEKSIEEEGLTMDESLMKEVPTGTLGARLSALLSVNCLAYTIRQNRLEIGSKKVAAKTMRIYDVTPLVQTVSNGPGSAQRVLTFPLVELIESIISSDDWQNAGGNCVIREFIPPSTRDCVCLLVLNSTENHLCIQNLLDHLNSVGLPLPSASRNGQFTSEITPRKPVPLSPLKRWQADRLDASKF